ncbi:MAG TPA: methanogenesis marker 9 domain-containing protein [Methanotrichaceae archaeon]|nr:methanogenesis marker 9 domain-containing protein [Methanotrichaceae archaeon]
MLKIGYLVLDNPIAITSSDHQFKADCSGSAGLIIAGGIDLDELSISDLESSIKAIDTTSAIGFSVACSRDEPIIEVARLAKKSRSLLELDFTSEKMDLGRLPDLVQSMKKLGATVSVRVRPDALARSELSAPGLDLVNLDVSGLNGSGPKMVKKAADVLGSRIMVLEDVGDFEEAHDLFAMGADLISLSGQADPEFASWLSQAMREYDELSGWYNAPKHICSGGDLRGLAFCCPPVKSCPVLGALKRAGISPDEFVERKLKLAKGTPLQYGDGTCFGSLVWCCKITKPCFMRDATLRKIGLSGREYMELKRKLAEDLFKT